MLDSKHPCDVCSHNETLHSSDGCDVFYCRCFEYRVEAVRAEPVGTELLSVP